MKKPSAKSALKLLEAINNDLGQNYTAYVIAPNVVLTLSGCRPICDQVYYSENSNTRKIWIKEVNTVMSYLSKHLEITTQVSDDTNPAGHQYVNYDLLSAEGLEWVLHTTSLLTIEQKEQLLQEPLSFKILDVLVGLLKTNRSLSGLRDDDIQYIASGILLGYPDKAIIGSIGNEVNLKEAAIPFADKYPCPQPIYDFSDSLADDVEIVAHQRLWNSILEEFYESTFHGELAKNKVFQAKITELGE